ncbi:hypothetical protein [Flavobacterium adhaerens]|uniref:hypothetical protein n=1 Tax=Flavobacterium adhaerens TaxID=3149043 RepID=UPI0032B43CF4
MKDSLFAKIQEEFNAIAENFDQKAKTVLSNEELITIQSKYNLFEIQPYFSHLVNQVLTSDLKLTIDSDEDFNPEMDTLIEYKINLANRKAHFKREYLGGENFYSTIYEYTEAYHKSFSVYQSNGTAREINLSYLYFKNGLPHQFIECTPYGISLKTYICEGDFIKKYKLEWPNYNHHCIGELVFDTENNLQTITETASDGRVRLLFDARNAAKNVTNVLAEIEDFLVENITDQILDKIKIEESVYCLLFEYSMHEPFPPTLGFGVESDLEANVEDYELWELYSAADMRYFSENDAPNPITIDFYPIEIQSNYLMVSSYGKKIPWQDEEANNKWKQQIFDTYLRVCKRLMHFDFSKSFTKSEKFLVMARDYEECNEEEFYKNILEYK